MLKDLCVCLIEPKFSENIGMAARACANMGCQNLALIAPVAFDQKAAERTATTKGREILESLAIYDDLETFLENYHKSWAVTARSGGWRKKIQLPQAAAGNIVQSLEEGMKVALIFGNEKQGLLNSQVKLCSEIISIPQYGALRSLNLAQAVLLILYECAKRNYAKDKKPDHTEDKKKSPKSITGRELFLLENRLKEVFELLDCNQGKDSDYYFIQWHNILTKAQLQKHEFDAFMGLCRQIVNHTNKA